MRSGILACLLWCVPFFLHAQPKNSYIDDVAMPAPNAASLGKYGDIPVSHFTGVPNISIPLTAAQDGSLSLPISVSYHASGLSVGQPASWVGAGWSLSAGGMISRTVLGIPDEVGYLVQPNHPTDTNSDITAVAEGDMDGEADLFSFNVAGYTGKFFFDESGEIRFASREDVRITYTNENDRFVRFILTTPMGVQYVFGNRLGASDNDGIERTNFESETVSFSGSQPLIQDVMTSWKLVEVISPDGKDRITLDYEEFVYSHKILKSCWFTQSYISSNGGVVGKFENCNDGFAASAPNTRYNIMNVWGRRLSKISTPVDTISFIIQSNNRQDLDPFHLTNQFETDVKNVKALDKIEHQTGDYCKTWSFYTSYFKDLSGTSSEYYRLKLDSIQQTSCDQSITIPPHRFSYIGPTNSDQSSFFPFSLSKAIDHWGYYNGKSSNQNNKVNVPPSPAAFPFGGEMQYFTYGSSDREPDTTKMKYGTLEKISYPTGGATFFEYSPHDMIDTKSGTENFIQLTNCDVPDTTCCGTPEESETFVFQLDEEIDNARFTLELLLYQDSFPSEETCIDDPALDHSVTAILLEQSTGDTLGSFGYNSFSFPTPLANHSIDTTLDVLEIFDSIQVGVTYTFVLNTVNAKGVFHLYFEYPEEVAYTRTVGGLRVRRITTSPSGSLNDSLNIIRSYQYQKDGKSSGVLYQEPLYSVNSTGTSEWFVHFNASSLVPLGNFNGLIIGYEKVTEQTSNNGYTEYTFKLESNPSPDFPPAPVPAMVKNGKQDSVRTFSQNGIEIARNVSLNAGLAYQNYPSTPGYRLIKTQIILYPDGMGGSDRKADWTFYQNRSGRYLVTNQKRMMDGVETNTVFSYNSLHNRPVVEFMQNSDGINYRKHFTYPLDTIPDPGTTMEAVVDTMISRNMIHQVLATTETANDTLIRGSRANYRFFNNSGDISSTYAGTPPYPYTYESLEKTWDSLGIGTIPTWHTQATVKARDTATGKPSEVQLRGWDYPEFYTWNPINKQIQGRTYQDFQWQYDYHPDTRLLRSSTAIDGQVTYFSYDDLCRLIFSSARDSNLIQTYAYHFREPLDTNNYLRTTLTLTPVSGSSYGGDTTFQYLDGLGRAVQTVKQKYSPDRKDVVLAIKYDEYGRPVREYEPFESTATTGERVAIPSGTPFSLTAYEPSPLNRKSSTTAPEWYPMQYGYGHLSITDTIGGVAYPAYTVRTDTLRDANGHSVIRFHDKRGRLLRTQKEGTLSGELLHTDYTYDVKDRIDTIYPPGTTTDNDFDNLIFTYRYDGRDNVTAKKVPDQEWIDYVYDERDLNTGMRDANMRQQGNWLHLQYDEYGRETSTGFIDVSGQILGATNYTYSDSLSRTWYDGDGIGVSDPIFLGKVSRNRSRVLGTTDFLDQRTFYDGYGRLNKTESNHIGQLSNFQADEASFSYDFADNVLEIQRDHIQLDSNLLNLVNETSYDHSGRVLDQFITINGQQEHLSRHSYSIKDELAEKKLGLHGSQALQSLDYTYLENGFLSGINANPEGETDWFQMELFYDQNPTGLGSGFTQQKNGNIAAGAWVSGANDKQYLYSYQYDFNDRLTNADLHQKSVLGTTYQSSSAFRSNYSYNERGNFIEVNRTGDQGQQIDSLVYSYESRTNKLSSVLDRGNEEGFDENGATPFLDQYEYDSNGNLTTDPYKKLIISYNHLNLPDTILQTGTANRIVWRYDAAGNKLLKEVYNDSIFLTGAYTENSYQAGTLLTNGQPTALDSTVLTARDSIRFLPGFHAKPGFSLTAKIDTNLVPVDQTAYIGGIEYRNNQLQAIYHPAGRATPDRSSWRHEYVITDHLGNTRVRFSDLNGNNSIDSTELLSTHDYFSYGMEWKTGGYKYTYNGKEENLEHGLNSLDFGARVQDPALGRFTSVDRFADKYTSLNGYGYAAGNPVKFVDVNGDSIKISFRPGFLGIFGKKETLTFDSDGYWYDQQGKRYNVKDLPNVYRRKTTDLHLLQDDPDGNQLVSHLISSKTDVFLEPGGAYSAKANKDKRSGELINVIISGSGDPILNGENEPMPGYIALGHELQHAKDRLENKPLFRRTWGNYTPSEITATHLENKLRSNAGIPLREFYNYSDPGTRLLVPGSSIPFYNQKGGPYKTKLSSHLKLEGYE